MVMWYRRRTRPWRVDRLTVEGEIPWYEQLRSPRVMWQLGSVGVLALANQSQQSVLQLLRT